MSPIYHLLNTTLIALQERQTNATTTDPTTSTAMTPQSIALLVISILFTLSELLGLVPEVGANGVIQGLLYYARGAKPVENTPQQTALIIKQLQSKIDELRTSTPAETVAVAPNATSSSQSDMNQVIATLNSLQNTIQSIQLQTQGQSINATSGSTSDLSHFVPSNNFVN